MRKSLVCEAHTSQLSSPSSVDGQNPPSPSFANSQKPVCLSCFFLLTSLQQLKISSVFSVTQKAWIVQGLCELAKIIKNRVMERLHSELHIYIKIMVVSTHSACWMFALQNDFSLCTHTQHVESLRRSCSDFHILRTHTFMTCACCCITENNRVRSLNLISLECYKLNCSSSMEISNSGCNLKLRILLLVIRNKMMGESRSPKQSGPPFVIILFLLCQISKGAGTRTVFSRCRCLCHFSIRLELQVSQR